jgi:molybdate transport system ATP-binding protein
MTGDLLSVSLRLSHGPAFALEADFQLPASGISVLFGASGSGKTTLLRAIAGLEPSAAGRVALGPRVWQDDAAGVRVPAWRRRIGYVFQEASLFEHLDVAGNIAYGLRWQREDGAADSRDESRVGVDALVGLLGIGGLLRRRVDTLSGGERQRVAIARAMATRPALLLLDEPLSALDFARRDEIMDWLLKLRDGTGTPMLYVTHSLEELARLADRALVLSSGRAAACDAPEAALRQAGLGVVADRLDRLRQI